MPNVKKVELRWGSNNAEVAEIKVRYEGCAEEPSDNPYAVPESDTFNPANVGGSGPIGPIPDVVEDPRPAGEQFETYRVAMGFEDLKKHLMDIRFIQRAHTSQK